MYSDLAPKLYANGWRNLLPLGVHADGKPARDPKACMLKGWSRRSSEPMTDESLAACVARYPHAGVGCAFGAVHGIVAIDIDIEDRQQHALVCEAVCAALPPSEFQRIGRAPKFMLFYRGDVRSSKHHGIGIEVFGTSGQTVLFAIHPKTRQPYRWPQKSPLDASPADLPAITQEQVDAFVAACTRELGSSSEGVGHRDDFEAMANERRRDGFAAARRQLMRVGPGNRHLTLLSVTGWLVSRGYDADEIAAFVDQHFPLNQRTEQFRDVARVAADMAHGAIARYADKDWSL